MFGFLFLVLGLLIFIVSEISIIQTYFALQAGNHYWHWRSFWVGAAGGIFFGLYMNYYFFFVANFDMFSSELIYYIWSI
jgi:transmembrane 9 superfamily protein 3